MKTYNKVIEYTTQVDYFGSFVTLNFAREKKFRTLTGGILSILIYCTTFALIIKSYNQLFNHVNPSTTFTNKYMKESPFFNLQDERMFFMAIAEDSSLQVYTDPTIFTMAWWQFTSARYPNGTQIIAKNPLPTVNCSIYYEDFVKYELQEKYDSLHLEKAICTDLSTNTSIGGDFTGELNSNIYLRFTPCRNSSKSTTICKPKTVIDATIYSGYVNIYYINKYVDVNNYTIPYQHFVDEFFLKVDPKIYKKIDMYFSQVNVSTDVGFIFDDKEVKSSIMKEKYHEDTITSADDSDYMKVYINISNNAFIYTRTYMKLQGFAALIGGIFQVLIILGTMITYVFTRFSMYEYMLNFLFINTMETPKAPNDFKSLVNCSNIPFKPSTNTGTILNVIHLNNNKNSVRSENTNTVIVLNKDTNVKKISKQVAQETKTAILNINNEQLKKTIERQLSRQQKQNKFKLSGFNVMFMYVFYCCSSKARNKHDLFEYSYLKLNKYLDYLEIIKTLQQFHKLKKIIFTKNQNKLFSYLNKPELNITKFKKSLTIKDSSYLDLFNSYNKAKTKSGDNKINRNILRDLDENIKTLFEQIQNKGEVKRNGE